MDKLQQNFIPGTNLNIYSLKNNFSFGIDAILLSNFAKVKNDRILVDIGAGTGIIGFRINAKTKLKKLILIEIQEINCKLMEKTVENNKIENSIILNSDLNDTYDLLENSSIDYVVSNPPYKKFNTGISNKDINFLISKYEYTIDLEDILKFSYKKLKSNGKVFLIYSMERLVDVLHKAREYGLEPKRIRFISSNSTKKPHLFLIELVKNGGINLYIEDNLYIYDKNGDYTDEVKEIYYG